MSQPNPYLAHRADGAADAGGSHKRQRVDAAGAYGKAMGDAAGALGKMFGGWGKKKK